MMEKLEDSYFKFGPAPARGALRMPGYWIWCASPILGDDGRYHLFVSRWSKKVTMLHWATNSEVIRAAASRPEGPYLFEEVVLGPRGSCFWDGQVTHNPTIHYHNGMYLLFYTGTTYEGIRPETPEDGAIFSPKWLAAWNGKRVGLAAAKSVLGPWKRMDAPLLQTRPGKWDGAITSNPAISIREDGHVLLLYKSANLLHPAGQYPGRFHLGAASAPHWSQPFQRLSDEPIEVLGHPDHHLEDPYIWWNDGTYRMVAKDMTGEVCGEAEAGIHATSNDGLVWTLSVPPKAYTRTILFDDGKTLRVAKRERAQFLIKDGRPTHLFNAILEMDGEGQISDTWSCVAPLV